jgi:hypothetical protein
MDDQSELIKVLVEDVRTIRDNHLHHVEKDMASMKLEVQSIDQRLTSVEGFVKEIKDLLKRYGMYLLAAIVATSGLPMLM